MALDIQHFKARVGTDSSRLGMLWRWGRNPATVPVILQAPKPVSRMEAVRQLFGTSNRDAELCRLDLLKNSAFFAELDSKFVEKRFRRATCDGWNEFLYVAVRFARPEVMIETGVFDGLSSSVILQALTDNNRGQLFSIDLPARVSIRGSTDRMTDTTLPSETQPGWAIPDCLRERHRLILGDSREELPRLFKDYPVIDIFFHDSLHTFEHQHFEYSLAWPHLVPSGLLLSDDIFWSSAFHKFCKDHGKTYLAFDGFGVVRK